MLKRQGREPIVECSERSRNWIELQLACDLIGENKIRVRQWSDLEGTSNRYTKHLFIVSDKNIYFPYLKLNGIKFDLTIIWDNNWFNNYIG